MTDDREDLLDAIIAFFQKFASEPIEDPFGPPGNRNNELRRTYKFGLDVGGLIAEFEQKQKERSSPHD